jgi:hypothetical protein
MRRSNLAILASLLVATAAVRGEGPATEDRSQWQYVTEVRYPEGVTDKYSQLVLPPEVFGKARADLADLRLFDDAGREVPYALRIREVAWANEPDHQPLDLSPRQAGPTRDGQPGSVWYLTVPVGTPPIQDLYFGLQGNPSFRRVYHVEAELGDGDWVWVATGEWRRDAGEKRPETSTGGLRIHLNREVQTRRLRLTVIDQRNEPLNLTYAGYSAPARVLVIENKPDLKGPLRLYFGNPNAKEPGYDFAASVPDNLRVPSDPHVTMKLGAVQENPEYRPTPKPWTERWPGLIYVALGLASVALLGILGVIARQALAAQPASGAT